MVSPRASCSAGSPVAVELGLHLVGGGVAGQAEQQAHRAARLERRRLCPAGCPRGRSPGTGGIDGGRRCATGSAPLPARKVPDSRRGSYHARRSAGLAGPRLSPHSVTYNEYGSVISADQIAAAFAEGDRRQRRVREVATLLEALAAASELRARTDALVALVHWMLQPDRRVPLPATGVEHAAGSANPSAIEPMADIRRLEVVIRLLEHRAVGTAIRQQVGALLAECEGVRLFAETGLGNDRGLLSETTDRLFARLLPTPRDDHDLYRLLFRMFPGKRDLTYLDRIPPGSFARLYNALLGPARGWAARTPRSRRRCSPPAGGGDRRLGADLRPAAGAGAVACHPRAQPAAAAARIAVLPPAPRGRSGAGPAGATRLRAGRGRARVAGGGRGLPAGTEGGAGASWRPPASASTWSTRWR